MLRILRSSYIPINTEEQSRLEAARSSILDGLLNGRGLRSLLDEIALQWEALQPGQRVSILVCSQEDGSLRSASAPSLPKEYTRRLNGLMPGENMGSCGTAVHRGEPVYVSDVQRDPLWRNMLDLAQVGSIRACWSVPFTDEDGIVLGTVAIYSSEVKEPDERDVGLMAEFTRMVALVVQKSRLATARMASEKRFSAIFEHAAVCILLLSVEGRLISANPRFQERSGYSTDMLADMPAARILHPDDLPAIMAGLRALRIGQLKSFNIEARYLRRDGSESWINMTVTLVRDTVGSALYYLMFAEEIDERKQQEQALREAAAVFEGSREGMLILDADFRIVNANPAFSDITGLAKKKVLGKRPRVRGRVHAHKEFTQRILKALNSDGYWQGEVLTDGNERQEQTLLLTATAIHDQTGRLCRYVAMFSDISRLRRSQEELQAMMHYDTLTGLANRTLAMQHLDQSLERAESPDELVAVLFIDLDRFKAINDSLGHASGDAVLCQVATRLAGCCQPGSLLARVGGDEFLMIVQGQPGAMVDQIAETVCATLRQPLHLAGSREIYVGASVGYAHYPEDGVDAADLVRNADAAMAAAKTLGRDQACKYSKEMTEAATQRFELDRALRKAFDNNEIELFYQPLVQVDSRRTVGVEALLRWRHPELGMIRPDVFIPLAEQNGMIVKLGQWVLRRACDQARRWHEQGLGLSYVAVNLSPRQFLDQNLVSSVGSALKASGLPADMLILELTESALMGSADHAEQTLNELKALGLGIAIDDFGTGYSSLAYLRRFPLDKLKIDKSFLAGVPERIEDNQLVSTIIDMASNLKLSVVAEGVETEEQWQFLLSRGCEVCQGYLFAKPLPAAELPAWLMRQAGLRRSRPLG